MEQEREKVLDLTREQIERKFGKGSLMRLGEHAALQTIESIPTGSLALDAAIASVASAGRIVEIFGPESSGKTTLALQIIAEAQRAGGIAAFVDAEHALDPSYAARLGVDVEDILISQPDTGEQALEITEALVRSGAIDVIVVDSVAALVPKAEIEAEMWVDSHVGLQARLMSQALRKLAGVISSPAPLPFLSTSCVKRSVSCSVTPRRPQAAVPSSSTLRSGSMCAKSRPCAMVRMLSARKPGSRSSKTKSPHPSKKAEFDIIYGEGISKEGCILDLAVTMDLVEKSGAWFSYKGQRIGQGRDNARLFLKANPEIRDELDSRIRPGSIARVLQMSRCPRMANVKRTLLGLDSVRSGYTHDR